MKQAVVVLLKNSNGQILGVSRKDDLDNFGLIGGKLEKNESLEQAAIRETKEETGLVITNLQKIFEHSENLEYHTTCFSADYSGEINTSEKGSVRWIDWEYLFKGSFGDYNRKLFAAIKE